MSESTKMATTSNCNSNAGTAPQAALRILHFTEVRYGGVVSCLAELLRHQQKRSNVQIEVLAPEANASELKTNAANIRIFTFPYNREERLALLTLAYHVLRKVWSTRPDIVHAHSTYAGALVRLLRPVFPKQTKVIYCPHGWAFYRDGSRGSKRVAVCIERILAYFSDRIICVSKAEARDARARGVGLNRLVVIYNGIAQKPNFYQHKDRPFNRLPVIGFIGRYDRQKGYDIYLEVMRRLDGVANGVSVGGAVVEESCLPPVPPNVRDVGWLAREEATELLGEMDLLLMPSRWEGLPVVALEALRSGVGIIATRAGGLPEIVEPHINGLLVDTFDADTIAAAIQNTDFETMRLWGDNARNKFLMHFTSDKMEELTWRLYEEVLTAASI